ncbi:hydrogenase 4 subunit B [Morganella morganii]|uniref:hydrogenase 4 subunit B n=1 Tax=Morganella morganii TaxID=582 RepID=UPI0007DB8944|nr:hydrogenase 4 subunit B [Morganella morganii]MBT0305648.1 hydrogenase 4 subunit B [Morganella morganii subsp. morganii]MBT0349234.1 hydrogenase 4 subunit B [Morganella morganii subsp. morganii]OAR98575.1 hydrogenase 4 subunit B [Morganella morganii]UEH04494.1 hydrogenase 4 subunit B [Morganella morganii]WNJ23929.1 hydrogenase 4 subunit B [Morganella morganii]
MTSLELLLWSVALYTAGGFISLLFKQQEKMAVYVAGITAIAGGILGLFSAVPVLMSGETLTFFAQGPFPFAHFVVRLDSLAAFMVMVISLLVTVSALYSLNYVQEYLGRGAWSMGFFLNLFIASMVALVVMDNAFWFIILFEMMSLASWFLVIADQDDKSIRAGLLYFFIAHAGSVLIMIAFFLMWRESGSLDFDSFRQLSLSPAMASVVFLLGFFGFGAKAGMLPLHSWLPQAHPAAPSHASALMSGVMVKIGIFGIIKVGIDLLGATQGWWGIVVLGFGAVSSVLGVMYALAEHDIKRLLAWHTVENIGIILMGVGVAMVGMANDMPVLATIGLLGAIYHLLNHAVFKGLLFLGAGAVIYRIHTRDMEKMGGLAKLMPLTATAFLIGCMAISALPPLNGFVSEWYTYQSLFSMSHDGTFIMKISGPIAIVMLAITGALAAMCFVKVYGVSFCGGPRSEAATHAREVPWTMTAAMLILAVVCVLLGVGASVIAPVLAKVAMTLTAGTDVTVAQGAMLVPDSAAQAMISPAMTFLLLLALPLIPFIIYLVFKGKQMNFRRKGDAWACGYAWERDMSVSAGGFTQPLRSMFAPLYRMRKQLDPSARLAHALDVTKAGVGKVEPFWDERIIYPLVRGINRFAKRIQCLQGGDFRLYCLYVVAALVVLLVVIAA